MNRYSNPLVPHRADPFITRVDGRYWFTATVPEYDRIELRSAPSIQGLADAEAQTIWHKHDKGPMSANIWAPELHRIGSKWYIYFAAGQAEEIFCIRMYVLENAAADPCSGTWIEKGQIATPWDSFSLDATSFELRGRRYLIWAQSSPIVSGNSSLWIASLGNPWTLDSAPVMISTPEFDWECRGFKVNEGPAVLIRNGRVFVSYSASATDANYCLGLLSASADANLLDPAAWTKSTQPVFASSEAASQFGPGHNSFTLAEDSKTDLLVYHARSYRQIEGDPLWNPDRHTRVQAFGWKADGSPDFGRPISSGAE